MPWENDKSTAADPDNPTAGEQLTADEWDDHVAEGHWLPDNAQPGQNADGDPIITDPQNGGATIMRYDRSKGSWVIDILEADKIDTSRSWNDLTASRGFGTLESNNSGSEITVLATASVNANGTDVGLQPEVDGLELSREAGVLDASAYRSVLFEVPAGSNYEVIDFRDTGGFDLWEWREFRP